MGVPRNLIQNFEIEFLEVLEAKHKDILTSLSKGVIGDNETSVIEIVAGEVAAKYRF